MIEFYITTHHICSHILNYLGHTNIQIEQGVSYNLGDIKQQHSTTAVHIPIFQHGIITKSPNIYYNDLYVYVIVTP